MDFFFFMTEILCVLLVSLLQKKKIVETIDPRFIVSKMFSLSVSYFQFAVVTTFY